CPSWKICSGRCATTTWRMPCMPTCCGAWTAGRRPSPPTGGRSPSPARSPSGAFSPAASPPFGNSRRGCRFRAAAFDHGVERNPLMDAQTQQNQGAARMKITVETHVKASLQTVWDAWNTPEDIKQWNAASDDWHTTQSRVDLREGGTFSARMEAKDGSMGFDFEGTYTRIVPQRLIEYRLGDDRRAGATLPARMEAKDAGMGFDCEGTYTRIAPRRLIEYRLGDDRQVKVEFVELPGEVVVRETFDAEGTHSIEQQREGWQAIL